ncbi:MAG: gamma-glutamyltransferase family protein [Woeseiaceae bacterium]|nr:gamma-glutamyltransferase family protein [Woeseiaceae bacterium]
MNRTALVLTLFLLTACATTRAPDAGSDTPGTQEDAGESWSLGGIVSAANPHAVDAAIEILEQGGHAVDAAIAAHAVLGLVEPQSSGLGGGGFLLVYERAGGELTFLDGRETAPAGATVDMFMRDGIAMDYDEAWQSGLSVGVPGTVALYAEAHERFGALPWRTLFEPAIRLADAGFFVSPRLAEFVERAAERTRLDENPATAAYFYPGGKPLTAGHLLRNPEYAATLRRIATEGAGAFYSGAIPAAIARAAQAPPDGGSLTVDDIRDYAVIERPVICGTFRVERICTTSPPSSGAAQIMIAGIYDHLVAAAATDHDRIVAFVDAQRLAYADRDHYFGDPKSVDVPLNDLLDARYLEHRAGERFAPGAVPQHGDPGLVLRGEPAGNVLGTDRTDESAGTTHLSIIDRDGNAISMTATIEAYFGSSRWAAGFLLNNEMTDFAREPAADGRPVANAIVPGNRPRSSMSPTMVFDAAGDILMVTGSPGGNSIPAYVAKSIIGVLDWALSAQEAVDFPNIIARGEQVRVEVGDARGQAIADDLSRLGYNVREREGENSGLHVVVVGEDGLDGAADRRREGIVRKTRDVSPR